MCIRDILLRITVLNNTKLDDDDAPCLKADHAT